MNWKTTLCGSASVLALGLMSLPAGAQDAALSSSDMETVVVTGIRASLEKGLEVKRDSTQVVESIAAEDIGKFPDNNVVEALQRISGVQVTDRDGGEVSTIAIRGMSDIETTWNGRKLFTADSRYFSVQDMPATLVSRLDAYKTRGANQVESGIGGVIDVKTRKPFDFDGFKFSAQFRDTYSEKAGSFDPNISALVSDTWNTKYGKMGLLVNFSYATIRYRTEAATPGAMVPFSTQTVYTTDPDSGEVSAKIWPGSRIFNTYSLTGTKTYSAALSLYSPTYLTDNGSTTVNVWTPGMIKGLSQAEGATITAKQYACTSCSTTTGNSITIPYVLGRDAIFLTDNKGKTTRPNLTASFQWQPSENAIYTFDFMYNGFRNVNDDSMVWSYSYNDGMYTGYSDQDEASSAYWDNITTYAGTNIIKTISATSPYLFHSGDYAVGKTNSFVYGANALWTINDRFTLTADFTYQKSRYDYQFFAMRIWRLASVINIDYNAGGGNLAFNFGDDTGETDPSVWTVGTLYDNASYTSGKAYTATLDGVYDLDGKAGPLKKVSFGLRYDDRGAKAGERAVSGDPTSTTMLSDLIEMLPGVTSKNSNFFKGVSDVPRSWINTVGKVLFKHKDLIRSLYGTKLNSDLYHTMFTDFQIDETNTAAYLTADFEQDLFGNPLTINAGLRWVEIKDSTQFWNYDTYLSEGSIPDSENGVNSVHDFLPSITVTYSPIDDLKFRFNFGETLRNPDFSDLNPSRTLNADVTGIGYGTGSQGNPDLKPTKSKNYDLTMEWYFAKNSAFYTTVFRRDIDGLVVTQDMSENVTGDTIYDNYNTNHFVISKPVNTSDGWLKGAELGLIYFPSYLPGWLDGLGFQGSMTFLGSRQNVPQTASDGTVTGQLYQPFYGISSVSYNTTLIYEHEGFSSRVSYVWRSHWHNDDEAASFGNPLGVWRRGEASLDLSASYDLGNGAMFTFDGVNLLNGKQKQYYYNNGAGNKNQTDFGTVLIDRRFTLGFRFETN